VTPEELLAVVRRMTDAQRAELRSLLALVPQAPGGPPFARMPDTVVTPCLPPPQCDPMFDPPKRYATPWL
jgi:hypothetical protein